MAFDFFGYFIAGVVIIFIAAKVYKKSTGRDISELWKNTKERVKEKVEEPYYQRIYVTKGIKQ